MLAAVNAAAESDIVPHSESLESFLSRLPGLWRQGEIRPTHARRARRGRWWRTRPDPFEGVWCEILHWLQQYPDITGSGLLNRLMDRYPGRYSRSQLRTLQRRVREWRGVIAKKLVNASAEHSELTEVKSGDIEPVGVI